MNLIDFHVTKVLGPPVQRSTENHTWWEVPVEYWDDGGNNQVKNVWCSTEDAAKAIQPGYVGQH